MALISKLSRVSSAAFLAAALFFCAKMEGTHGLDLSLITAERLYGEIAKQDAQAKPNFVFSPFSIFSVFHDAQRGAAGDTKKQMDALVGPEETFKLPEMREFRRGKDPVTIDVANKLYVHPHLEGNKQFASFKGQLQAEGHTAESLNFSDSAAAAAKINSFVAEVTRDHITNLINPSALGEMTRLVLVNALYFKAPWLESFIEKATSKGVFNTPSGPKEVLFMQGKLEKPPLLYSISDKVVSVGLPYGDERLRLYVFMPSDLSSFEAELVKNPKVVEDIISEMEKKGLDRSFEEKIHLKFPKFKLNANDNKLDLAELFQKLGATDMFSSMKADFSGISGNKDLSVSSYLHQADIDVNENGTEATAATAMAIMLRSMPIPKTPVNIEINKPFVFQLRFVDGETNAILFSGRLADPSTAQ